MSRLSRKIKTEPENIREKLIGLGESSIRKCYYPELMRRHEDLARFRTLLEHISDAIFLLDFKTGEVVDAVGNTLGIAGRRSSAPTFPRWFLRIPCGPFSASLNL